MNTFPGKRSRWWRAGLLVGAMVASLASVEAEERTLTVLAPPTVGPNGAFVVTVSARTDAVGEQVGFLQVEFSMDLGQTWTPVCYLQNSGPEVAQSINLKSGPLGTVVKVRARAAYRDGLAGDVDYRGAAIMWEGNWQAWKSPPAKHATIRVVVPPK